MAAFFHLALAADGGSLFRPDKPDCFRTMRILIIEDEAKTREYLKKGLSENSFIVDSAEDGAAITE